MTQKRHSVDPRRGTMLATAPVTPFSDEEFLAANREWGCNCGPTALAYALGVSLDTVRAAIPQFEQRHYTNPTMMLDALHYLGRNVERVRNPSAGGDQSASITQMFAGPLSLVRIQWTGAWTHHGLTKWASKFTHWIVTWRQESRSTSNGKLMVYDANGGLWLFQHWEQEIVPAITKTIRDADGLWYAANVWRLLP